MRLAASLAIIATALAAALTLVAVRALGAGVEAHPFTRYATTQVGWVGYVTLSIAGIAIGLRLLALLPLAEWGVRAVAAVKVADAIRDAWLVSTHPTIDNQVVVEVLPALSALVATTLLALLVVRAGAPRLRALSEVAT